MLLLYIFEKNNAHISYFLLSFLHRGGLENIINPNASCSLNIRDTHEFFFSVLNILYNMSILSVYSLLDTAFKDFKNIFNVYNNHYLDKQFSVISEQSELSMIISNSRKVTFNTCF